MIKRLYLVDEFNLQLWRQLWLTDVNQGNSTKGYLDMLKRSFESYSWDSVIPIRCFDSATVS